MTRTTTLPSWHVTDFCKNENRSGGKDQRSFGEFLTFALATIVTSQPGDYFNGQTPASLGTEGDLEGLTRWMSGYRSYPWPSFSGRMLR